MNDGYATWHSDAAREPQMEEAHRPYWRHFIATIPETDLSTRTVLDFGCNRGGFLRLLHALKPFHRGLGVDIARDSVAAANALRGTAPVRYEIATSLDAWPAQFDIAFSYEVIYLLPDLADHAAQMHAALKPGGVYYAVTGCHTHCPLWPDWRTRIAGLSNAPVQDRAPDDYANAFIAAGFEVSVRRFGYDGFVPAATSAYYPCIADAIRYAADDKLMFRIVRPD